jgi:hypothetical protein
MSKRPFAVRFWEKVDRSGGPDACWDWQGSVTRRGYGQFSALDSSGKIRTVGAHRLAWELHNHRPIPPGLYACHACDRPRCCNPLHVHPATPSQNSREAYERNRHPGALTSEQVAEARRRYSTGEPVGRIAADLGAKPGTVSGAALGRSYRHVAAAPAPAAHHHQKLSPGEIEQIRSRRAAGELLRVIAADYGVDRAYVGTLCRPKKPAAVGPVWVGDHAFLDGASVSLCGAARARGRGRRLEPPSTRLVCAIELTFFGRPQERAA